MCCPRFLCDDRPETKRKFEKINELNYDHVNLNDLPLKHLLEIYE
jgi:hypothetical protein